jgi:molybdate transport system substrate-binding protein
VNVKAVLSKVALGEADAGIVYVTDISLDAADEVGKIDIPDNLNTIASYPIATLKGAKNAGLAQKFVDYVLAPEAQAVLAKYGFIPI